MNYTQAQIDRANAVSLEDFLRTQGETLIKSGREYRWKEHDSLTVRGNKWFRHSQSKGGYPIDFVMEFYGKSFPEAVQLLTGESGEGQTEAATAPPTAFHLPLHNRTADRAIQYLTESRCLNKTLVEAFLLSGDIYEDAKRHNVVFVGRDRSGTPRYAHVRGTADPFRQDIVGSDKSYPFRYEGNGNQLFAFESPIDLLSFICLYPQDWQSRSYLALGGVSGKALDRFLSERKDTRKVFLCLDSTLPFDGIILHTGRHDSKAHHQRNKGQERHAPVQKEQVHGDYKRHQHICGHFRDQVCEGRFHAFNPVNNRRFILAGRSI